MATGFEMMCARCPQPDTSEPVWFVFFIFALTLSAGILLGWILRRKLGFNA